MSRRRREVADALAATTEFTSAQEVHAQMRAAGSTIGLSTVYRALQLMVDEEEADLLLAPDGEALYRRCSTTHHHHLVCRGCGHAEEVQAPAIERWATELAEQHGFTAPEHVVEVTGLCRKCSTR